MLAKKVKLQIYFILIACFNTIYKIFFLWCIRWLLLTLTGSKIGRKSCIQGVRFFAFGKIQLGENTVINSGCYLDNRRSIKIGSHVVIAHDTKIYTLGHDINDETFKTKGKPVVIEDFVIIFANALIMPGVNVKRGAVVLPGSVVSKDVEEMTVVGGNPARAIKRRDTLHTNKESYRYWFSL
jgi:acetyltransferase-like isoleucine patch superfamily enzyme